MVSPESGKSFPGWVILPIIGLFSAALYYQLGSAQDVVIDQQLQTLTDTSPPEKMQAVHDIVAATPNVVGIECWSMVQYHYIAKGWMEDGITETYQIDAHHAGAVTFLGQQLG